MIATPSVGLARRGLTSNSRTNHNLGLWSRCRLHGVLLGLGLAVTVFPLVFRALSPTPTWGSQWKWPEWRDSTPALGPNQMRYQAALDDAYLSPLQLFFKPSSLSKSVLFYFCCLVAAPICIQLNINFGSNPAI